MYKQVQFICSRTHKPLVGSSILPSGRFCVRLIFMKVFKQAGSYQGKPYDVLHWDVESFAEIPDRLITKAHAVCVYAGKMIVVHHTDYDIWGLPGGTRDKGESMEEALAREIKEETNCQVIDFTPICYQKIIQPQGEYYRLQYLCNVQPLGEFRVDPAGNIDKVAWINPADYKNYCEAKEFRQIVFERAIELLKKLPRS